MMQSIKIDKWTSRRALRPMDGTLEPSAGSGFCKWLDFPAGMKWIDVCCGSGVVTEAIVELSAPASVAGVDASAEQIGFARRHRAYPNVTFETGDATRCPFRFRFRCGRVWPRVELHSESSSRAKRIPPHHPSRRHRRSPRLGLRARRRVLAGILGCCYCDRQRSGPIRPRAAFPDVYAGRARSLNKEAEDRPSMLSTSNSFTILMIMGTVRGAGPHDHPDRTNRCERGFAKD